MIEYPQQNSKIVKNYLEFVLIQKIIIQGGKKMSQVFAQRLREAMSLRRIKQADLVERTGIGKSFGGGAWGRRTMALRFGIRKNLSRRHRGKNSIGNPYP
mgnify:CR=1 FL=1